MVFQMFISDNLYEGPAGIQYCENDLLRTLDFTKADNLKIGLTDEA